MRACSCSCQPLSSSELGKIEASTSRSRVVFRPYKLIARTVLLATFACCLLVAGNALAATFVEWNIGINQSTPTLVVDDGTQGLTFKAFTSGDTATIDIGSGYPIGNLFWTASGTYTCADKVTRSFLFNGVGGLSDRSVICPFGLTVKNFAGKLQLDWSRPQRPQGRIERPAPASTRLGRARDTRAHRGSGRRASGGIKSRLWRGLSILGQAAR